MSSANDQLRDAAYRHAVHAERYSRGLATKIVKLLNASDDDLVDQIASRVARIEARGSDIGAAGTKRLHDLLVETRAINAEVYQRVGKGLRAELVDLTGYEIEFAEKSLKDVGFLSPLNLPPASYLKTLVETSPIDGHLLDSWTEHMSTARQRRVEQAIRLGLVQGQTTDQIVSRVRGTRAANYGDGIFQISRQSAQTLALTGSSTVANNARTEVYKRNSNLIKSLQWLATLDTRTSQICQSRDGEIYPVDKPHPTPPAHPRCRSVLIPVTKSFKEMGLDRDEVTAQGRASMDGQVSGKQSFGDWLTAQPEARQAEVLGAERAQLFRDGKVAFKDLFNETGAYRSLAELRAAEGIVRPPAPEPDVPAPRPAPPAFNPDVRNPAVTDAAIDVQPRLAIQKEITADLALNAKDFRYDPLPEFRGVQAKDFGKASFSTAFTDEAVSMIAAILPELNVIAARFSIPRLRTIRTVSGGGTVANMGDGTLGLNAAHFNGFAGSVGEAAGNAAAKAEKLATRATELGRQISDVREQLQAISGDRTKQAEILRLLDQHDDLMREYKQITKQAFEAKNQARRTSSSAEAKVAEWKPGDDLTKRPYTVDKYFAGIDQARAVMYHEMGHHVHQMYARRGRRRAVGDPPIERLLDRIWAKVRSDKEATGRIMSKYAFTNSKEYFAEQFALYHLGRKDWADPDAVKLIEELMNGEHVAG